MKVHYRLIGVLTLCFCLAGCREFVDIDLPNSMIVDKAVFADDQTAISAIKGMYYSMDNNNFASGNIYSVTAIGGLVADELIPHNIVAIDDFEFYENEITISNSGNASIWSSAYNTIYMANAILEGLEVSDGVTGELKKQLQGEALFVRAFSLFYLVNLYGDVPLVLTTDYRKNALLPREAKTEVYTQIITDLEEARELLSIEYVDSDRTRPNHYTATALLARVYLYLEEWQKAETMAGEVIDATGTYELLQDLDHVFLVNSREALWQIMPDVGGNTNEGNLFIIQATPPRVALTEQLLSDFSPEDQRTQHWVSFFEDENGLRYYYPYKYKIKTSTNEPIEYSMVLRYGEQFLLRAEARVQQDKLGEAIADLDKIRERAAIPLIADVQPGIGKTALLDTILQERRREFFTEWGHRWLDLKRTHTADAILGTLKPTWQATDVLFPIPENEMIRNPNLKPNNDGY